MDPSAMVALGQPQSEYFGPGGALGLTGSYALASVLDLELHLGAGLVAPAAGGPVTTVGTTFWVGPGLRLRRGRDGSVVVPWLEAGVHFNQTGQLPRASVCAGAGVLFRVSESSGFFFGPQVKYLRILGIDTAANTLTVDANLLLFGLAFEFAPSGHLSDQDGDSVVDAQDACPTEQGPPPSGCPVRDADSDGVPDGEDACPSAKGMRAFHGCPEPDPDHDGVIDAADKCPDQPEDKDGFEDEDGCPDLDNDKDGILDAQDACPNQVGLPATRGCPDSDGDRIADAVDSCPEKPGPVENGGCPAYKHIVVTETKIELLQKIFFAFGKTNILLKSFDLLNEVAAALKDHPKICVRIEGHTDAVGAPKRNLALSEDRTISVMKFLADQGVDSNRMTARGYGQEQPLETNATPEGRERNRRVEFVIMKCGGSE